MTDFINFTPDKVKALQRAYTHAVEIKADAFTFEGQVVLTSYAKYLLEYLATTFPKEK